jgi:hypothetical protein
MIRVVLTLVVIGLVVYALVDLGGANKEQTGGLPKWLWAVVIVILPVAGSVAWLVFRRIAVTAPAGPAPWGGRPGRAQRSGGPVAPDDDPDFLRSLDEQRRRDEEKGS